MPSDIKQLNLGQKIRKLREGLGLTLGDFAAELGIAVPILQQIEKNEISPPVATLLNIAHHCGEELGYFFDVGEEDKPYSLVKHGSAKEVKRVLPKGKNPLSYTYKTLAHQKAKKHMEPFLVEFSLEKEEVPQVAHDGEEFLYVLEGTLEFNYRHEKIKVEQGDSLYFESKYPHAFKAIGKKKAKALVVLYPH